jgi:cytochrome b
MSEKRLVWDLPLRLFHGVLALSLVASWYTAEMSSKGEFFEFRGQQYGYAELHFWLGYWALGLICFRLIWGFVGPKHARFTSFFPGPRRFLAYAGKFFKRDSPQTVGHNPMGALVVVLMLLMVGAQAVTGLFLIDNTEIFSAPYHESISGDAAGKLMHFHHLNFDVLQWVVGLHIVAVLFYRLYKRQKLIGAMVTGCKESELVPQEQAIKGSQLWKALIVALVAAGIVWLVLSQAPPPPDLGNY